MENNWKKKLLGMFLSFALCLSMIPASAMAEETPSERLSLDAPKSITYTEDLTITAKVDTTGTVTYKWFEDGNELTGRTGDTLTLKDTPRTDYDKNPDPAEYGNVGDHTFRCKATIDGDVISKEVTVTVNKADLSNARLEIKDANRLAYDPVSSQNDSGIVRRIGFDLWYNDKYLTVQSSEPWSEPIDASDYTVTGNKGVKKNIFSIYYLYCFYR